MVFEYSREEPEPPAEADEQDPAVEDMEDEENDPNRDEAVAEESEDGEDEDFDEETFRNLDAQLDQLNSVLDALEQKNDGIHDRLKEMLKSNREAREQNAAELAAKEAELARRENQDDS